MVRQRATSRRVSASAAVESSTPVTCLFLSSKSVCSSSFARAMSSSAESSRSSLRVAMAASLQRLAALHDARGDGQLVSGEVERLLRDFVGHADHLVEDAPRLHHGDVVLHVALTGAHSGLSRLLGDRLVREDPDPELPALLHVAGDGDASRLDLAGREPTALRGREAVLALGEIRATVGLAAHAALHHLAVLRSRRLKHCRLLVSWCSRLRPGAAGVARRTRARRLRQDLAAHDPDLAADLPVGRLRLGEPVVDVRTERVQRNAPLAVPLVPRHLGAAETAGARDPDPLRAELERGLDRLLHRTPEGDAPLELRRDVLRDELRVGLGLADLDHVEEDLVLRQRLEVLLDGLDPRAALPDDDPGPGGVDVDLDLVGRALDLDTGDARLRELLLDELTKLDVLVEPLRVVLLFVPLRVPGTDDPEAEPDRVNFLSHVRLLA